MRNHRFYSNITNMSFPNITCLKQSTSNIHIWNALAAYCGVESFSLGAHRIVIGTVVLLTQWAPWVTQLLIQISCQNWLELPFAIKNSSDSVKVASFYLPQAAWSLYHSKIETFLPTSLTLVNTTSQWKCRAFCTLFYFQIVIPSCSVLESRLLEVDSGDPGF